MWLPVCFLPHKVLMQHLMLSLVLFIMPIKDYKLSEWYISTSENLHVITGEVAEERNRQQVCWEKTDF